MSSIFVKLKDSFLLNFAVLFGATAVLHGSKPPFDNEYIYLLPLARTYQNNFLLNDFSFAVPGSEHWLFNHIFGLPAYLFPIEFVGWSGRLLGWGVLLFALIRLAKHWAIPLWMVTIALLLWLCVGQAPVGGEWMIGTFEAKNVAYICLLFALDGFARGRYIYPAILLGLTFSFHPAVGLWAAVAAGMAFLYCRFDAAKCIKAASLTVLFALPGLLALILDVSHPADPEDWKFLELVRYPQLFDPFSWSKSALLLVYLQLAFCLLVEFKAIPSERRRFLTAFVTALALIFTAGVVLRVSGQYELLRLMPMRLFPMFVSLFFFFSLGGAYLQKVFAPPFRIAALAALLCLLLMQSPLSSTADIAVRTVASWRTPSDDTAACFLWLRENTPNGSIVIAPPWRQDFWHLSHRTQIASWNFPIYSDLGEWRRRVETLAGPSMGDLRTKGVDTGPEYYHQLTAAEIGVIAERYRATYLVSETAYPLAVMFSSGKSKVYLLDASKDN